MRLPRRAFLHLASGAGAFPAVSRVGWGQAMNNPMHWQDSLLALNPWARELWGRRRELVQRNQWNLYYIDQGGNDATRRWLTEFRTARHKASRERLAAGKNTWNAWAERTSADHYQAQGGASQRRKIAPADRQLPGPDRPGYSATGLQALADAMSPNGCRRQRIS